MAPLNILADAGLTLTADDGRLLVHPRHLLTDDLRALIRDSKPDILAALSDLANVPLLPVRPLLGLEGSGPRTAAPLPEIGKPLPATLTAGGNPQRSPEWDERRTCQQCRNLSGDGRCLAAWRGELRGVTRDFEPIKDMLQRCASYAPGPDDIDKREARFAAYCISKMNQAADSG